MFIMQKLWWAGFYLLVTLYVNAVPSIGITNILYASSDSFQNIPHPTTPIESSTVEAIVKFNTTVIQILRTELADLNPKLQAKLSESGTFITYNAESRVMALKAIEPQLLRRWEVESTIYAGEESPVNKLTSDKSTIKSGSYILIGWVTYIDAHVDKQLIAGTDKKSILYNLDVQVKYKLFDNNTKQEVAEFEAKGHGGYATIVPANATINHYDPAVPVKNAISSLVGSVQHGLLIKQSRGDL